jgi:hypothetical protein
MPFLAQHLVILHKNVDLKGFLKLLKRINKIR